MVYIPYFEQDAAPHKAYAVKINELKNVKLRSISNLLHIFVLSKLPKYCVICRKRN